MLPRPITALALSAFVSFASLTATSAMAAPNPDGPSDSASSHVKASHAAKKDKKATSKKKGHLASLHAAEPKESPKESPKLAASLNTKMDLKKVSDKTHASTSKKPTLAATGKETFIGGPTGHAGSKSASSHAASGAMAKSGRAPARHTAAAKSVDTDDSADDHPVLVSVHTVAKVAPKGPCLHEAIDFVRGAETDRFPMTKCDGAVAPLASERLSVLVRPDSAARPANVAELAAIKGEEIAPGVKRIDPGLLVRLQTIADHFAKPGLPERVAIVSGYRPESTGSFHASAQALDFHLEGVPNEALVDFCKTLENTGCGYYPNSSFVHVDVRPAGTGHVAWIDTSGPGEAPHYVASWPLPPEADVKVAEKTADEEMVNPYTQLLPELPVDGRVKIKPQAASINAPLRLKDWE